jgi:hypothetical protein
MQPAASSALGCTFGVYSPLGLALLYALTLLAPRHLAVTPQHPNWQALTELFSMLFRGGALLFYPPFGRFAVFFVQFLEILCSHVRRAYRSLPCHVTGTHRSRSSILRRITIRVLVGT